MTLIGIFSAAIAEQEIARPEIATTKVSNALPI